MNYKLFPLSCCLLAACSQQPAGPQFTLEHQGDTLTVINVTNASRYLLLPIQEEKGEVQVRLNTGDSQADTWMDIRLAIDSADYYVPFLLPAGESARIDVRHLPATAATWDLLQLSDTFDTANREYYRPLYHHTPAYGWMNDPNGMTYLDGEYHLYYQYNPYGSKWANMHWGHSVTRDLVHWEHCEPAIARDQYGQIFSGSSVVARVEEGQDPFTADVVLPADGGAQDFIASYYTSDNGALPNELVEQQSYAISTDHGRTFRKYGAPVLKSDGRRDFRDPKLFWNEQDQSWGVIISAFNEMQFFRSTNLRDWEYVSAFGDGYGAHPRMFECPDFFPLNLESSQPQNPTTSQPQKWVMIVNVNPGCWFGGSASEYFVGDFDGKTFTCDSKKEVVKWLDYGKDHYAAVTFSNEPKGRIISIPWMSNWQYANDLPTQQYRSANGMARELFLFQTPGDKEYYVGQRPVAEMYSALQLGERTAVTLRSENANLHDNDGALLLEFDIDAEGECILSNDEGEQVVLTTHAGLLTMDRNKSGIICREEFAVPTWAPIRQLCGDKKSYHVELWLDRCSVELFVDGGRASMTNLVYPHTPYNNISGQGLADIHVRTIAL